MPKIIFLKHNLITSLPYQIPSAALSTALKLISKYSIQALDDLNLFGLTFHHVAFFPTSSHLQYSYSFTSMH